eukprot:1299574-Pleurochrysis_carterae.AAC.1
MRRPALSFGAGLRARVSSLGWTGRRRRMRTSTAEYRVARAQAQHWRWWWAVAVPEQPSFFEEHEEALGRTGNGEDVGR